MPGVPPHTCQLNGLILLPSPNYPSGPLATIPASGWADTVNTRLLSPILTTQLFLPLLTLKNNHSSILLLYPTISSALSPPFSTPEVATTQALSGFATSLRRELRLLQSSNGNIIDVVELKLGNIDLGPLYRAVQGGQATGTEVLTWNPQQRALYGSPYLSNLDHRSGSAPGHRTVRGTPAHELHFAVFDALAPSPKSFFGGRQKKKEAIYVGRGSRAYVLVGTWVPGGLVGWMLGLRSGYTGFIRESPRNGYGNGNTSGSGSRSSSSGGGWERVG
jgi:NAD(P)-dependent dehydrogenase (short-subunit alcohol dehydrogenase family)